MKRAVYILIIINLIGLIIMATDKYIFEKPSQASVYPPSVDLKLAVEAAMDEILPNKIFDLIWKKTFHFQTFFEALGSSAAGQSGWAINGTVNFNDAYVELITTAVSGNSSDIRKDPVHQGLATFKMLSRMRSAFYFDKNAGGLITKITAYLIVGQSETTEHYGFYVNNGNIYGTVHNGTSQTTLLLQSLADITNYNIEAWFSPNDKVIFLINSVEKGVITTNIPKSITANQYLFYAKAQTDEAVRKDMRLSFFEYFQMRDILK